MALFPDYSFGLPRLLASDASEIINLQPGQQNAFAGGVWALGGNDTINGSTSPELILGNQGNDVIAGGEGNDRILGGRDNDAISGLGGDDLLRGDRGNDTLLGGEGNDIIRGGEGSDVLNGGSGNDFLVGDLGVDVLIGDAGFDTLVARREEANFNPGQVDILFYDDETDFIGITGGLVFNDLSFGALGAIPNTTLQGTPIFISATGQILAYVANTPATAFDVFDFISIPDAALGQIGANPFNPI